MELREGYKQTKIGRIPESWSVIKLGDQLIALFGLTGSRILDGFVFLMLLNLINTYSRQPKSCQSLEFQIVDLFYLAV